MPLYKSINTTPHSKVFIWKVEETTQELQNGIQLTEKNQERLNGMKSELHQKGFLAVRQLLKLAGYDDSDVVYDKYGKPHLNDGKFISITHSFNFCGLIVAENTSVGIDIEKQRDKIIRIADKFTPFEEYKHLSTEELIKKLTIVWGAKESLYKIYGKKQLLFKDHIYVEDFDLQDHTTIGEIRYDNNNTKYTIHFLEFEGFTCVYVY